MPTVGGKVGSGRTTTHCTRMTGRSRMGRRMTTNPLMDLQNLAAHSAMPALLPAVPARAHWRDATAVIDGWKAGKDSLLVKDMETKDEPSAAENEMTVRQEMEAAEAGDSELEQLMPTQAADSKGKGTEELTCGSGGSAALTRFKPDKVEAPSLSVSLASNSAQREEKEAGTPLSNLNSLAFRRALPLSTPETEEFARRVEEIRKSTKPDELARTHAFRELTAKVSPPTLTWCMLSLHEGAQSSEASGRRGENATPTDLLHTWSPEIGTARALSALSAHRTDKDDGILEYLETHSDTYDNPRLLLLFWDGLTWAGKVSLAVNWKDTLLEEHESWGDESSGSGLRP